MKKLLTLIVLSLSLALSMPALAADTSTLRVVTVQTADVNAYIGQLQAGKKLMAAIDDKFKMRAWQATFAGDDTGAVVVSVEYPGSFSEFAVAWEKLAADPGVSAWLAGLSAFRTVVSDSLYKEHGL